MERKKIIRSANIASSINIFFKDFLKQLNEQYEVVVLTSPGPELKEIEEREGVRTIPLTIERRPSIFQDVVSLIKLIKVFRKEKPFIVHSMSAKCGLLCMMAAKIAGVPHRVHSFTGLAFPTATGLSRRILIATEKLTCLGANHLLPEGNGVRNDLLNNKITNKRLVVLGNGNIRGVDMDYYSCRPEVLEKANLIRKKELFTFLFVGRIVGDKGINELVSAFAKLVEYRDDVRLILVGEEENLLDPVKVETKKVIDSCPQIIAPGPKYDDELLSYYAASDCFVFPSYREGFPNVVLEAGAMGLPSIVTDINGSNEIIINGKNGIIIPSHDTDALLKTMMYMIDNKDKVKEMAESSRMMVSSRYEVSFVRSCLMDFYRSLK